MKFKTRIACCLTDFNWLLQVFILARNKFTPSPIQVINNQHNSFCRIKGTTGKYSYNNYGGFPKKRYDIFWLGKNKFDI